MIPNAPLVSAAADDRACASALALSRAEHARYDLRSGRMAEESARACRNLPAAVAAGNAVRPGISEAAPCYTPYRTPTAESRNSAPESSFRFFVDTSSRGRHGR